MRDNKDRVLLKTRMERCEPCAELGHDCWAHAMVDGVNMCTYCDAGEPCLKQIEARDDTMVPTENATSPVRHIDPATVTPVPAVINNSSWRPPERATRVSASSGSHVVQHAADNPAGAQSPRSLVAGSLPDLSSEGGSGWDGESGARTGEAPSPDRPTPKPPSNSNEETMDQHKCENPACSRTVPGRKRYCSTKCNNDHYREKARDPESPRGASPKLSSAKTCANTNCAKTFTPTSNRQLFCTPECKKAWNSGETEEPRRTKVSERVRQHAQAMEIDGKGPVLSLRVSEEFLDKMLTKLPINRKLEIVQAELMGD